MSRAFFKPIQLFISLIILLLFICFFFTPTIYQIEKQEKIPIEQIEISEKGYAWPTPGYTKINSYFGKRTSPTAGASSYHKGIDIGAPEGAYFIAIANGKITYTGFLGGGGYTITLTTEELKITYCHVSPNFMVKEGEEVTRGKIIGKVGPKYVYGVPENQYKDDTGKPTNGATTGAHLHLGVRTKEGNYLDPFLLYEKTT